MIEKFPYVNTTANIIKKYNSVMIKDSRDSLTLNNTGLAALLECNGEKRLSQIMMNIVAEYCDGDNINEYIDKTLAFFQEISEKEYILYADSPSEKPVNLIDVSNICYPENVVFELTDFCNLKCKYCYRDSNSTKSNFINTESLLVAIEELSKYGLKSVHLTGGEPSMHKDFLTILTKSLEFCKTVIILSNGTNFSEKELDIFAAYKDRIKIQVDLDCSDEAIHDDIRGVKGSFASVAKFIKNAAARKVAVEVAMNVCETNLEYIEKTIILSKKLGAASFSCNVIMEFGRGENADILNDEQTYTFLKLMPELYEKYDGFVRKPDVSIDYIEKRLNCGGGHRNLVCSPDGDIRPCILMPPDMLVMGNLFDEKTEELFAKPVFKHFANLQAPNRQTCGDCKFERSCLGCFSKVLLLENKMKESEPGFICRYKESIMFK